MPTAAITASTDSSVQTTSMAASSTATAVSETIEPMLDEDTNRTATAIPSRYYHAFIITPIVSLVVVVLIVILIVAIVKSKKGDRQKSRKNRSPDKVEGNNSFFA